MPAITFRNWTCKKLNKYHFTPSPPPGGEYCEGTGLAVPTEKCAPGYYCSAASPVAKPTTGSSYGDHCTSGYFCPNGSAAPQPCTPGYNCPIDKLSTPFMECDPGYYCSGLAILPNPTDGTTGDASFCCMNICFVK